MRKPKLIDQKIQKIAEKNIKKAGEEIFQLLTEEFEYKDFSKVITMDDCVAMAALSLNPHAYDPCGDYDGYNRYCPLDRWVKYSLDSLQEQQEEKQK